MVPREGQNFIIKGRGRLKRKEAAKKREERDFSEKRTISKVGVKRKKTQRENEYCFPVSCKSHYYTYSDSKRIKLCKF